jgi:hypothetical protein
MLIFFINLKPLRGPLNRAQRIPFGFVLFVFKILFDNRNSAVRHQADKPVRCSPGKSDPSLVIRNMFTFDVYPPKKPTN